MRAERPVVVACLILAGEDGSRVTELNGSSLIFLRARLKAGTGAGIGTAARPLRIAWLPWLRRACPSATLDKEERIQLSDGLYQNARARSKASTSTHAHRLMLCRALAIHDDRRKLARLGQVDVVFGRRLLRRQLFEREERQLDAIDVHAPEELRRRFAVLPLAVVQPDQPFDD